MTKRVVVILSGGLDSTTLLYDAVKQYGNTNVKAINFFYGQKQHIEVDCAKKSCDVLGVEIHQADLSFLGNIVRGVCSNINGSDIASQTIQDVLGDPQPLSYVPNRNMILLSIATAFAEAHNCTEVLAGFQTNDTYGYFDTTQAFVDAMNNVNSLNRKNFIEIKSPFGNLSKAEEIKIGTELGVDYSLTFTCYNPNKENISCGICPSCAERINGFKKNGLIDPIQYQKQINWSVK